MALADLKVGTTVTIKVVKQPTNASATKTLGRVWLHNPQNARFADKRENTILEYRGWGGRVKPVRLRGSAVPKPKVGDAVQIRLTTARILDLKSLERFIEVA